MLHNSFRFGVMTLWVGLLPDLCSAKQCRKKDFCCVGPSRKVPWSKLRAKEEWRLRLRK